MKVEVITHWYNEEFLAPFFLNHYAWADKITVVIDSDTTDSCVEIARSFPNVEIRGFKFSNGFSIVEAAAIKTRLYLESTADYVVAVDADEFIYCNTVIQPVISHIEETQKDVYFAVLWQIHKHEDDGPLDLAHAVPDQRRHGVLDEQYIKPCVVKTGLNIIFGIGIHSLFLNENLVCISGEPIQMNELNVSVRDEEFFQGSHWRGVDLEHSLARIKNRYDRLSDYDYEKGWGIQFTEDEAAVREMFELHKNDPVIVYDRSFI